MIKLGGFLLDEDITTCNEDSIQLIYEEVLDQWRGNFRTNQTLRERLGQIIAFIGIILNLELLAIIQIVSTKIPIKYMEIMVLSSFFIIISLITAAYAYRAASFKSLRTHVCLKPKFTSKSKNELIEYICEDRLEHIQENKEILKNKAAWTHISLNNLVIGIILVAIFIIFNIATSYYIIGGGLVISVLITWFCYKYEMKKLSKKLAIIKEN